MIDPINLQLRDAHDHELDRVYLMGEDVWSDGASTHEYLEGCRSSLKYKQGQFKVLTNGEQLLSSLIVYDLSTDRLGIGSIATPVPLRQQGYASKLVELTVQEAKSRGKVDIFLFSDIGARFYEKLGFTALPPSYQQYADSICMLKTERTWNEWVALKQDLPKYF